MFTPLNPALPGPEAVEALRMACEHRTAAHWSGPRFFGLIRKPASNGQPCSEVAGSPGAEELADG